MFGADPATYFRSREHFWRDLGVVGEVDVLIAHRIDASPVCSAARLRIIAVYVVWASPHPLELEQARSVLDGLNRSLQFQRAFWGSPLAVMRPQKGILLFCPRHADLVVLRGPQNSFHHPLITFPE